MHEIVHNASRITHAHPISLIACGIYCSIANEILCGHPRDLAVYYGIEKAKAVYARQKTLAEFLPLFQEVSLNALKDLPISSVRSSGYVLDTLVSALWCLLHTDNYQSCVLQAVNLGEDTDTVGAVAGGLAGLYYGLSAIPKDWIAVLSREDEIEAQRRETQRAAAALENTKIALGDMTLYSPVNGVVLTKIMKWANM